MHLRPVEHLENRWPKCKMHTQERQLTRFFVFYNWSTKKTEPNQRFFPNQTEPEKSIPHIPSHKAEFTLHVGMPLTYTLSKQ